MGEAAWMLRSCEICEHRCRVDRDRGEVGFCGLGPKARVYRSFLHWGEEPEISPTFAVLLAGCSFRCAYCSEAVYVERPELAPEVDPLALARRIDAAFRREPAARTVSFIGGNPDESLPSLLEVIDALETDIPVVWNSNLYLSPEALSVLRDRVDVFLPDLKFGNDACARIVARIPRYTEVVQRNLLAVHGRRRLIVRHLIMPGHVECCTRPVVRFVSRQLPEATLNLMTQYEPLFARWTLPPGLERRPSESELEMAHA